MKAEIEDIVNITENKSKKYDTKEIVGVCKRLNNTKRDFLFVNKYQGKHFPQNPNKIFEVFDEFIQNIENSREKILIIGFAETATAIGNYLSAKLQDCVFEMQTTREVINGEKAIIEFKEEHSHAPTQLLYGKKEQFNKVDRVMFVEDEITTGKTIINFINEIKKINPKLKYSVASILNWQDDETSKIYEDLNIETYYLIKGKIKDVNFKLDIKENKVAEIKNNSNEKIKIKNIPNDLCSFKTTRIGRNPIKDIEGYSCNIYNKIVKSSELAKKNLEASNKNILVIGTEEFMYEPLLFAKYLENSTKNNVFYQATTRSPIDVSKYENYTLNTSYKFSSCYEEERTTYLYNLKKYDSIFILTDNKPTDKFVEDISNIFYNLECNLDNIEIINFGEV